MVWYAAPTREIRAYCFLVGKLKETGHLEDLRVDERLILEWISNWLRGRGLDVSGSAYEK